LGRPFAEVLLLPFLRQYNKRMAAQKDHWTPITTTGLKRVEVDGQVVPSYDAIAGTVLLSGDPTRVTLFPKTQRDKLVIDDNEVWASDEEEEDKMGHRMHRENLRILTPYLHRAGLWRVRLSQVFEVLEVVGGVKGGPPQPNEFSLKVTADGEVPTTGTLQRLTDAGAAYVKCLVCDLQKVARAKTLAGEDALATKDSTLGDKHLQEMRKAVHGELPKSRAEVVEEERQRAAAEAAARAAQREADEREVEDSLGNLEIETELEKEHEKAMRKAAKKARQKARQREAKQHEKLNQQEAAAAQPADGVNPDQVAVL
jgi:hypothetical protein